METIQRASVHASATVMSSVLQWNSA